MKLNKNTVGVEAVNKALEILNCFTEKNEALTVTKIAQITGDHKSRISRISKSLENFGYIRKIKSGEFKIGHSIPRKKVKGRVQRRERQGGQRYRLSPPRLHASLERKVRQGLEQGKRWPSTT